MSISHRFLILLLHLDLPLCLYAQLTPRGLHHYHCSVFYFLGSKTYKELILILVLGWLIDAFLDGMINRSSWPGLQMDDDPIRSS